MQPHQKCRHCLHNFLILNEGGKFPDIFEISDRMAFCSRMIRAVREMPERETIRNFPLNGRIREVVSDDRKLDFEHHNDIKVGTTAQTILIGIQGFRKRTERRPVQRGTDVMKAVTRFFITGSIRLSYPKTLESSYTEYYPKIPRSTTINQ